MYFQVALLLAGTVLLYGQSPRVSERETTVSATRDAELLSSPLSLDELTEEKATQLEDAARRQVDRAKSRLERARTMVDAGLEPRKNLDAPAEELASVQAIYDLTLSRTQLVHQWFEMASLEQQSLESPAESLVPATPGLPPVMEHFDGGHSFTPDDLDRVKNAFEQHFHKMLPVSAEGETAVHRAMGFDHRNRVDVALFPDTSEGIWLRHYLEASKIPYYAFRSSVVGKATAAHIHIGPPSTRMAPKRG
jgi:hypothetical protein